MPNITERDKKRASDRAKERYAAEPEYRARKLALAAYHTPLRRKRLHAWWHEFRESLRCEQCGEGHIATLDFHHTNPAQKERSVRAMVDGGLSQKRILAEIAKCRVLCSNCHRKLHWSERSEEGS